MDTSHPDLFTGSTTLVRNLDDLLSGRTEGLDSACQSPGTRLSCTVVRSKPTAQARKGASFLSDFLLLEQGAGNDQGAGNR